MSFENKGTFGSLFGGYSSSDPMMNVPGKQKYQNDSLSAYGSLISMRRHFSVTSSPASSVVSPYLNVDPSILGVGGDSQFILPEGQSHTRGRFEMAFSQIGGSVFGGAVVGATTGLFRGVSNTSQLQGAIRRTQLLNYVTKQGASTAQTLGVVAFMYSGIGVILSKVRGADDEMNTVAAATLTGTLFKLSGGLRSCARGGLVGFGLSSAYLLVTRLDRIKQIMGMK
ncbi:unnamed protein product [Dimorphilus gyrociliatus]|uniref:Uncharacterized protein n=1 Tax=Dimorphilus gyrociliatus TaxID=2664684 RepID=A0A7I8V6G0_9ANNE|nr:unnamed protein product [Dimorphilus gyrociliatus]